MSSFGLGMKSSKIKKPKFGIIGGSGMCTFEELKVISKIKPKTKYGFPSDTISICEFGNEFVAFIPRHGSKHAIAPHKVPYKANLAALKEIGVEYVIGTCITGSLKNDIAPGSIVLPDQFVNLTWGRDDYYEADESSFIHLPMGEPYCNQLRKEIIKVADKISLPITPQATVAVIQGPRFSTAAESQWLSANGWDIVNMTQYPECYFARELELCYAAIATVTDYDVGLQKSLVIDPNNMNAILEIFKKNIQKTKSLLLAFSENTMPKLNCECSSTISKPYYDQPNNTFHKRR